MPNTEATVISAVCKNKDISVLLSENTDDLFTTHRDVWEGLKSYYSKYRNVPDADVLEQRFRDFEAPEVKGETAYHLDALKNDYLNGRIKSVMLKYSDKLKGEGGSRVLEQMQSELSKLNRFTNNVRDVNIMDVEDAERHYAEVHEKALKTGTVGMPTGFASIDSAYHTGMAPGHLIYVLGWPGRMKTWFTGNLACRAFDNGYKVMIVSLEMTPEAMRDRIYTMLGSGMFRNSDLARGDINLDDFRPWAKKRFNDKRGIVIVSNEGQSDVTPNTIQAKIDQHKPDLVILDYHQLFMDNRRTEGLTPRNMALSREIKLLAVSNNIPIIDITAATSEEASQRESPPMLSQVAWSKAIEYDADMAFAVHRHTDSGLIEIVSRKNRHGNEFAFYLDWDVDRGIVTEKFDLDA